MSRSRTSQGEHRAGERDEAAEQQHVVEAGEEALAGGVGDRVARAPGASPPGPGRGCPTRRPRRAGAGGRRPRPACRRSASLTLSAPRPTKIAPQTATPTATPTWRKVSLMPAAMPLCSFGTTLTATSAITGLRARRRRPATMKPGEQRRPLGAGVDAATSAAARRRRRRARAPSIGRAPGRGDSSAPGDRRDQEARDRDRQVAQAGLEGRVGRGSSAGRASGRGTARRSSPRPRSGELDAGEGGPPEQAERQHRLARRAARSRRRRPASPPRRRTATTISGAAPALVVAAHEGEDEQEERAAERRPRPAQSSRVAWGSRLSRSLSAVIAIAARPIGTLR